MSATPNHLALDRRIRQVWRRGQGRHLAAGALAWLAWTVPLLLLGVLVDWKADLPTAGRAVVLVVVLVVPVAQAWRRGWRCFRAFNATHTALQIERHHGGMESLLVTAVQFADPARRFGGSESLQQFTRQRAAQAVSDVRAGDVVDLRTLRRPAVVALLLAGLVGVAALVNGPILGTGIVRLFAPWRVLAYPTKTQLDLGAGELVIREGDGGVIEATVSGVVPDKATLSLLTGSGRPREVELEIRDGVCAYTIESAYRDFTYRIAAGDARSDWRRVRVVAAPRIERVRVRLRYPEYLRRDDETFESLTLTVPEGADADWQVTLDRPIRRATLLRDGEPPVPLDVDASGLEVTIRERVGASGGYRFAWVDREHGFEFDSPRYYLQVASDQPPRVELTSPRGDVQAMLGRAMPLTARARDDHAIVGSVIRYRLNQTPEQSADLAEPLANDDGAQPIDWDYRRALPDVEIGDTVAFAVEVTDGYPGADGPHRARSETRRITFLSEQEYLEQIGKKRDRLLSRVRTLYRQQREAHELVLYIDPTSETFTQTCQLEAVRQELLGEQLRRTARAVQALLDDLAANSVKQASAGESLAGVRAALDAIADQQVARAADLLRDAAGQAAAANGPVDPMPAARMVNAGARALGRLVMQRDIISAREVFAREAHMLAQVQAAARLRTLDGEPAEAVAELQTELGEWTAGLLTDLRRGMRYTERPLAVLRLSQLVREMETTEVAARMARAAGRLRAGEADRALALQADLIETLLSVEFQARIGAEIAALSDLRDLFAAQSDALQRLRTNVAGPDAERFAARRGEVAAALATARRKLLRQPMPQVPAALPALFDAALPAPPPVRERLADLDAAMRVAAERAEAGDRDATAQQLEQADAAIVKLMAMIDGRIEQVTLQAEGATRLVARVAGRGKRIGEIDTQQLRLMEQVLDATDDQLKELADLQRGLADEVAAFGRQLRDDDATTPAFARKDTVPLAGQLERVGAAMAQAATALDAGDPDRAIAAQEAAAGANAAAAALTESLQQRLAAVSAMREFQRSVRFASTGMADIVAEQRDTLAATRNTPPDKLVALAPVQRNLIAAVAEVAPVLDVVGGRVDAGSALLFAGSDMDDALVGLEGGDRDEAADAQDIALGSLAEVGSLVRAIVDETGYIAEVVEFLYGVQADADVLLSRQKRIAARLAAAPDGVPDGLLADQRRLRADALAYAGQLERATGLAKYGEAAEHMQCVVEQLEAGDPAGAAESMTLAQGTLTGNLAELFEVMKLLRELPASAVTLYSSDELVLLIDALSLASRHRSLTRHTAGATAERAPDLAATQRALLERCGKLVAGSAPPAKLVAAHRQMTAAAAAMQPFDAAEAATHQQAADEALRHFVIQQTMLIIKLAAASSSPVPAENYIPGADEFIEWSAGVVSGELPTDKQVEWESLGRRTRAALNENFARELPLEYRGMLKNYYERLAR